MRVLESLECQSMCDFEVLIIDDCSTDNSLDVINNYKKESKLQIRVLSTSTNSGPGVARGIGIDYAQGQYICFIDSDDYIAENYTSILESRINRSNPDLVYFGCCQIVGNKKRELTLKSFNRKDDLIALSTGSLCRFTFKRDLLRRFPLPSINNAEDIAIIPLIINAAERIVFCDKVLYYYVHRSNSLSSNYSPKVTTNFIKSFDYTLSFLSMPYTIGIEFHGIKTVLYGAILNGLKAKIPINELEPIIDDFERKFPFWINNRYINLYSYRKRVFLRLVYKRNFRMLKFYIRIHNLLLKYL